MMSIVFWAGGLLVGVPIGWWLSRYIGVSPKKCPRQIEKYGISANTITDDDCATLCQLAGMHLLMLIYLTETPPTFLR